MALVNVVDSHIISKRMPSIWVFLIPAGAIHFIFGLIIMGIYPFPCGVDAFPWFIAVLSSVLRTAAVLFMLYTMRTEEISRIIPVVYVHPIFVAILAVPLLDETLSALQWLAIFMTVAGAMFISARRSASGRGARLRRSFVLLISASLLFGLANTATKYALDYISFWNMYSLNAICFGVFFWLVSARPSVFRTLREMKDRGFLLKLIAVNETIALAGIVLGFWAMERGPISLVTTVLGTRPFFVFLFALALSHFYPAVLVERFTRATIAVKVVSIGLILGGISIINLVGDPNIKFNVDELLKENL